jgi:predicted TIM-barrel fold metal-dependent hydrolase
MYTSYHHTANVELEQSPQYYWDNHMYAAFMLDPLGLELIDRIGRDRVMWSTDFPHIESTFGYSEKSLAAVVDALGPNDAASVVSQNVLNYLGLPA